MRYQIIERCRAAFPVRLMCRSLQVSASGYYDWREREPSPRDKANDQLLCHSRRLHTDSDGVLGAPPGSGKNCSMPAFPAAKTGLPD